MNDKFEAHEAAGAFPMMESLELAALAKDIETHGQREPIVRIRVGREYLILDGRNRFKACKIAATKPLFRDFGDGPNDGDDPYAFVASENIKRRHLDESQRAMVAAKIASLRQGRPNKAANLPVIPTQDEAAKIANVGERSVRSARAVLDKGANEVITAVERGQLAVSAAEKLVDLPKAEQRAVLAHVESVEGQKIKLSHALRKHRRDTLSTKLAALPPGKFRVLYADPPWKYGDERAGLESADSAAAAQYPTMSVESICALSVDDRPVTDLVHKDAVLFLWATFPLLEDALTVVAAWGFKYKTAFVWDKQRANIGNYHDASAELMLIATRGSCPIEIDTRPKQVQSIARAGHSEKPEPFRALIDLMYPSGPRVELFRRGAAPAGWIVWGNEATNNETPVMAEGQ